MKLQGINDNLSKLIRLSTLTIERMRKISQSIVTESLKICQTIKTMQREKCVKSVAYFDFILWNFTTKIIDYIMKTSRNQVSLIGFVVKMDGLYCNYNNVMVLSIGEWWVTVMSVSLSDMP